MFGLAYLIAFVVYLTVSILVVRWAVRYARKREKSGMLWGFGAAFIMYNLVFWDWIPTVVSHKYYCSTEAGFWAYKTVDQWKAENPGVMETLSVFHLPEEYRDRSYVRKYGDRKYILPDGTELLAKYDARKELLFVTYKNLNGEVGYRLNERFYQINNKQRLLYPLHINLFEQKIINKDNGEVLARYTDFSSGGNPAYIGFSGLKFWLNTGRCTETSHLDSGSIPEIASQLRGGKK